MTLPGQVSAHLQGRTRLTNLLHLTPVPVTVDSIERVMPVSSTHLACAEAHLVVFGPRVLDALAVRKPCPPAVA